MDILEKTIEDIIYLNQNYMSERGFPSLYENVYRQLRLPSRKIIDLFSCGYDDMGKFYFNVIELKRGVISESDIGQACEYACEVLSMLIQSEKDAEYEVVLIGSAMTDKAASILELQKNLSVFLYEYKINGVFFTKIADDNIERIKEMDPCYLSADEVDFLKKIGIKNIKYEPVSSL